MNGSLITGTSDQLERNIPFQGKSSTTMSTKSELRDSLVVSFLVDVIQYGLRDTRLLSSGGNTGTPNSFVGVDPADLTKGVFNAPSLLQGNNLECFILQVVKSAAPGLVASLYNDVTSAIAPLAANIDNNLAGLNCPQLLSVDESQYDKYPGYQRAKGP